MSIVGQCALMCGTPAHAVRKGDMAGDYSRVIHAVTQLRSNFAPASLIGIAELDRKSMCKKSSTRSYKLNADQALKWRIRIRPEVETL